MTPDLFVAVGVEVVPALFPYWVLPALRLVEELHPVQGFSLNRPFLGPMF